MVSIFAKCCLLALLLQSHPLKKSAGPVFGICAFKHIEHELLDFSSQTSSSSLE